MVSYQTAQRVVSLFFTDTSQSNQINRAAVIQICRARLERLLEEDPVIDGKFADRVEIVNNAIYTSSQHLDCDRSATSPTGIGKEPGTDLAAALNSMNNAIQHQRVLGTRGKVAAILVIQAAEPTKGKKPIDSPTLSMAVQKITKEGFLTIIGPESLLQSQLNQTLANVPNVKVCSFSPEDFGELSHDKQLAIIAAIEQAAKEDLALDRLNALKPHTQSKFPANYRQIAQAIVIAIGAMTFSASSHQVAKYTVPGIMVAPATIAGGVLGACISHELAGTVMLGVLLNQNTKAARNSINRKEDGEI